MLAFSSTASGKLVVELKDLLFPELPDNLVHVRLVPLVSACLPYESAHGRALELQTMSGLTACADRR